LIALKYFSLATFETAFAQACQLAKSIGLHQSGSDSENAEQVDLWWSLFIIDVSLAIALSLAPANYGIEARVFHGRQALPSSIV
jgi:hypothetical protein